MNPTGLTWTWHATQLPPWPSLEWRYTAFHRPVSADRTPDPVAYVPAWQRLHATDAVDPAILEWDLSWASLRSSNQNTKAQVTSSAECPCMHACFGSTDSTQHHITYSACKKPTNEYLQSAKCPSDPVQYAPVRQRLHMTDAVDPARLE